MAHLGVVSSFVKSEIKDTNYVSSKNYLPSKTLVLDGIMDNKQLDTSTSLL